MPLEYEGHILKCLRRQIFGARHDLNGIDLTELGGGDKRLSAWGSPHHNASEDQSTSRCNGKPFDVAGGDAIEAEPKINTATSKPSPPWFDSHLDKLRCFRSATKSPSRGRWCVSRPGGPRLRRLLHGGPQQKAPLGGVVSGANCALMSTAHSMDADCCSIISGR